jgi:hypothetical protein
LSKSVYKLWKVGEALTPISMFEGTQELDPVAERNVAERRFSALAAAVREHEARVRRGMASARPYDLVLYRRMRQILAEEGVVQ